MQRCRPKQPPLSCGRARAGSLRDRPEGLARESAPLPRFLLCGQELPDAAPGVSYTEAEPRLSPAAAQEEPA